MSKRKHEETAVSTKKPKTSGHWAKGLLQTMKDPEFVVNSDDSVTIIRDAYPKAEFHYLVLPMEDISSLKAVKKEHLSLLEHMEAVANDLIREDKHKHKDFKLGYHAEASMLRLHLHVISDDMNSACLKTKKHWNSFNTAFFINSTDVVQSLKQNGRVVLPGREQCKKFMEQQLQCHKCDYKPKNMPDLKGHILKHLRK
ncbi:hypothetical protein NQ315_006225 [Exocentrus adspersus]|uniref:HIT domain-containing protein n=1 Tax=Exocentrus adspersus TaxID=1586481 RepID=A0AAV8VZ61_9CUCU|nr:hypothetical protein NQ315_006225 [Exocentrus adspersus]